MMKWTFMPMLMLFSSVMTCLVSSHWVVIWMMMEMNTFTLIMMLSKHKNKEMMLMFFCFQTFSSMILLLYMFSLNSVVYVNQLKLLSYILILSILLKNGMAPFQSWMVEMSKKLSWINLSVLMTWQKIIPLIVLSKLSNKINITNIFMYSMVYMSVVMISMVNMKKILMMSSLIHSGWMTLSMKLFKMANLLYLFMYSMMVLMINIFMMKNNIIMLISQLKEKSTKFNMNILIFSMCAIPPSLGFLLKFTVIISMVKSSISTNIIILVMMSSSLALLAYMNMFYKTMNMMKNNNNKYLSVKKNYKSTVMWMNIMTPMFIFF